MSGLRNDIAGAVLAGGKSTRMKSNKALLSVDGVPFIRRIVDTLERRFSRIYISANRADDYVFLNHPIIPDVYEDGGPLAGIHAVLKSVSAAYVFTVSCDVPFISTDVIDTLIEKTEPDTILIADDGTHIHPLIGIYPRSVCDNLGKYLQSGERKARRFLETVDHKRVDVSHAAGAVKNINTVEEYQREIRR